MDPRPRQRRSLLGLVVLAAVHFGDPDPVRALSCSPLSYSQMLAKADEVFVGTVKRIRKKGSLVARTRMRIWNLWLVATGNGSAAPDRSAEGRVVEMSVLERFKGPSGMTAGLLMDDESGKDERDQWGFRLLLATGISCLATTWRRTCCL